MKSNYKNAIEFSEMGINIEKFTTNFLSMTSMLRVPFILMSMKGYMSSPRLGRGALVACTRNIEFGVIFFSTVKSNPLDESNRSYPSMLKNPSPAEYW